jgi:hypothetical protein
MKCLPASRPRNPWVTPTRFRLAGAHRNARHASRQAERQALHRTLRHGPDAPPDSA